MMLRDWIVWVHIVTGQVSKTGSDPSQVLSKKINLQIVAPMTLDFNQKKNTYCLYTYSTRPPKKRSTETFFFKDVCTPHMRLSGNKTKHRSVTPFIISKYVHQAALEDC